MTCLGGGLTQEELTILVLKLSDLGHHRLCICMGCIISHLQGRNAVVIAIPATGAHLLCATLVIVHRNGVVVLLHPVQVCLACDRLVCVSRF